MIPYGYIDELRGLDLNCLLLVLDRQRSYCREHVSHLLPYSGSCWISKTLKDRNQTATSSYHRSMDNAWLSRIFAQTLVSPMTLLSQPSRLRLVRCSSSNGFVLRFSLCCWASEPAPARPCIPNFTLQLGTRHDDLCFLINRSHSLNVP